LTTSRKRLTTIAFGTALLLGIGTASASESATQPSSPKRQGGSIVISVAGLPFAVKGKIRIRGPHDYSRIVRLAKTKTLRGLRPGTYRLVAKPVRTGMGKARAQQKKRSVTVSAQRAASASFLYVVPGTV